MALTHPRRPKMRQRRCDVAGRSKGILQPTVKILSVPNPVRENRVIQYNTIQYNTTQQVVSVVSSLQRKQNGYGITMLMMLISDKSQLKGNIEQNRFRLRLKLARVLADLTYSGRLFHTVRPATKRARSVSKLNSSSLESQSSSCCIRMLAHR